MSDLTSKLRTVAIRTQEKIKKCYSSLLHFVEPINEIADKKWAELAP
jgi:hypothetical protein